MDLFVGRLAFQVSRELFPKIVEIPITCFRRSTEKAIEVRTFASASFENRSLRGPTKGYEPRLSLRRLRIDGRIKEFLEPPTTTVQLILLKAPTLTNPLSGSAFL